MSETISVLVTQRFSEAQLDILRAVSPRLVVNQHSVRDDREDTSPLLFGNEEILYCFTPPRDIKRFPKLKWIQLHSAGIDHLHGHPVWDTDILVTTTSGIHAVPIGEFAFALMLALARRLPRMIRLQERADWPQRRWELLGGTELRGKTIGIIGYGSIGREIGRIAVQGFGMRVVAMRRGVGPPRRTYREPGVGDPEGHLPETWFMPEELPQLLGASDFVVLSAPLTEQTRAMIGEAELRAMKPNAYLINVARGELIDDRALVQALKENWIAGAGLDAFSVEPLPRGSQYWHMENVIVSPHVGGATSNYDDRATKLFAENLRLYLAGSPLMNVVSRKHGY